jgi:cytochrome c-type biogenesis protein
MESIFETLTLAVSEPTAVALLASFTWGILSIILSPCHLASIPLIIGFIDNQGVTSSKRACLISTLFSIGILITIAVIGILTALSGRMMGDIGSYGNYFVSIIFFVVGLHLLDVIPNPWSGSGQVRMKRKGPFSAFILGLLFGIALGPCTFAFLAPILGMTFQFGGENVIYGIVLLSCYGLGHCSVIIFAGTFTERVQAYLNWNENSGGATYLKKICGFLVLISGLYFIYTA